MCVHMYVYIYIYISSETAPIELSNLKPVQLEISLDSKVFALLHFWVQQPWISVQKPLEILWNFGRKGLGFRCKSPGFLRFSV